MFKVLIAIPVHESKDYAMERWLENVSRFEYLADLLIVDNSPGLDYIDKLRGYCEKYSIKNYQIKHIELPPNQERFERMARSREIIRQEVLSKDYDAWFSWESDIIISTNTFGGMVELMQAGNFLVVDHQCWMRGHFPGYCTDFGLALVSREALKKYNFLFEFGTDTEMPDTFEPSEAWFKRRLLRDGFSCAEVEGILGPVVHLNFPNSKNSTDYPYVYNNYWYTSTTKTETKKMKILIGTPIHESKDYAMERWLENVSKLEYPADLFLVDNSPGVEYVEKVKGYCAKYRITNYQIEHIELPQEQEKWERIARSREIIRQKILLEGYDAWFVWECDQLIPTNALTELIKISESENYMMVNPNKWARENSNDINTDFGCCLIKKEVLEKYGFLLEFGTDMDMPNTWEPGEAWFKSRVLRGGDSYIDVYGIINPIYHLNK